MYLKNGGDVMSETKELTRARMGKNDEFYTQLVDIELEMENYATALKGKVVYCNCDDPIISNFWNYFHKNFSILELKKLVATHYIPYNNHLLMDKNHL